MKKILLALVAVMAVFTVSARDSYSRDVNVLPAAARTTLKSNFKSDVNHIKIDKSLGRVSEYDVVLNDGTEITFDRSGNWKEIEVKRSGEVPAFFVPQLMAKYIGQYQKGSKIVGLEKKRTGYDVELSNGVEMRFDKDGKFVRYEDWAVWLSDIIWDRPQGWS